jgi:hypothetical protein
MRQVEKTASGMILRIVATILVFTAFLVGSLIYVGFYAGSYDLFQKIIVVLVAFILATATVAIMWVSWAGRRGWMPHPDTALSFLHRIHNNGGLTVTIWTSGGFPQRHRRDESFTLGRTGGKNE